MNHYCKTSKSENSKCSNGRLCLLTSFVVEFKILEAANISYSSAVYLQPAMVL